MNITTGGILRSWAQVQPETIAVIDGYTSRQLSYAELDRESDKAAWALSQWGVQVGDVIAYVMTGSINIVILLIALGKLGAAWTPLNPNSQPTEWVRQWSHAGVAAVVTDNPAAAARVADDGLPWIFWSNLVDAVTPASRFPLDITAAHKVGILYTSGTTGAPKGAWHTHQTLWGWHYSLLAATGIQRDDRIINPYPLFHMGGVGFTLAGLQAGATVILDTPFDAAHHAETVLRLQATLAFMVPTMAEALLDLPAAVQHQLGRAALGQLVTTSAPLLTETYREMCASWPNLRVSVLYSATEAIFSLLRSPGHSLAPLCVGRPTFGSDLLVLDDQHQPCGVGVPGTVYVRGVSVFSGYHRSVEQFRAWYDDWFTCFDIGYRDADGFLYLVDRAKDLINSGGEKISSVEIENVLRAHPAIKEVAVVGLPDQYWGERVHAVVVRRDPALTAAEVRAYARQHLPAFKVPKTVAFQNSLPKTDTGKILKRELRLYSPAPEA